MVNWEVPDINGYQVVIGHSPNDNVLGDAYWCAIRKCEEPGKHKRREKLIKRSIAQGLTYQLGELGMEITEEPAFGDNGSEDKSELSFTFRPKDAGKQFDPDPKLHKAITRFLNDNQANLIRNADEAETRITDSVIATIASERGLPGDTIRRIIEQADELRRRAYSGLRNR